MKADVFTSVVGQKVAVAKTEPGPHRRSLGLVLSSLKSEVWALLGLEEKNVWLWSIDFLSGRVWLGSLKVAWIAGLIDKSFD